MRSAAQRHAAMLVIAAQNTVSNNIPASTGAFCVCVCRHLTRSLLSRALSLSVSDVVCFSVCALDASGQMSCFAFENVDGRASPLAAPGLAFAQLAAGDRNTVRVCFCVRVGVCVVPPWVSMCVLMIVFSVESPTRERFCVQALTSAVTMLLFF